MRNEQSETKPATRRKSIIEKRRRPNKQRMRRSLVETEEVLGKGEPIRSQEGALGSDLTELLDRGSRSQRLETRKPHGVT